MNDPKPLLATKFYLPPPRPKQVVRARLIDEIRDGLEGKLTLISAPAGYGKTTLLSELIGQVDLPGAFLSLDERDNDIRRFFEYLFGAFESVGLVTAIEGLLSEPISIPTILTPLINKLSDPDQAMVLILDDYHMISAKAVHKAVLFLLDYLPPHIHVIIATRTDPPLRLAQFRAQGDLFEIRAADLRFNQLETINYINQKMGLDIPLDDIQILMDKTEGWIVGLQLAAISLEKQVDRHGFVAAFAGDDRYVMDYLLDEVLSQQDGDVQVFLLHTSPLVRFCASLCDTVIGWETGKSRRIIDMIDKANLFVVPLDNRREWYRYHHLFASLLQHRLNRSKPSALPELHKQASLWYERQGLANQAVMHAIQGDDIQRIEDLVREYTLAILELGDSKILEQQLSSLGLGKAQENLWVIIAQAWSRTFSGQIEAAEDALRQAQKALAASNRDPSQLDQASGHIFTIRSYISDLQGDPVKCKANASQALKKLPKEDHLTVAFALMMLATSFFRNGDLSNAECAVQEGLSAVKNYPYSYIMIDLLCMQSKLPYLRGQLFESEKILQRALELSKNRIDSGGLELPVVGFAHIYLGGILYEWNRLNEACVEVVCGLEMLESWGDRDGYLLGIITAVRIFYALGDDEQTLNLLKKARDMAREIPYWYERVNALDYWLQVKTQGEVFIDPWQKNLEKVLEQEFSLKDELIYRYLIKIYLLQGNYDNAAYVLNNVDPIVQSTEITDNQIRMLVLRSAVLAGLGDEEEALLALRRALVLAEPGGYVRVFLDEGDIMARLLYQAAQRGFQTAYCLNLLDEFSKYSHEEIHAVVDRTGNIVESLTAREQEVLDHIAEGSTNQEIALELHLSLYTVKSHARNIYGKLGVKNRTEAVAKARLLGLLKV